MIKKNLRNAMRDPVHAFRVLKSILKGQWYVFWYENIRQKATFGKNFKASGTLSIKGPGMVHFGNNVRIDMVVTPWTDDKDAAIYIGNDTFLNGTRFGCQKIVSVGNNCILASCSISDTDYHGTDPDHRDIVKSYPVTIKDHVWVTTQCIVLKGVTIGTGSTISAGSVVVNDIPPYTIARGNPAQIIKKIQ